VPRRIGVLVAGALLVACSTVVVAVLPSAATPAARAVPAHTVFGTSWTVYHHDGLGSGVDPTNTNLSPATPAWTSAALDGQIYGEPLVQAGRVVVATENDTVYELAADSGAVLWSTHVGTAVPSGNLPCTNISPAVGITGTPVIDAARGEVFAVTDEAAGSEAQHYLVGLDLYTGAVLLHQAIVLPGSDQLAQLQRTGLALDGGTVVAGFGGNSGDCGNYHGWVVGIPEGGGAEQTFQVASAPGDSQGAIWMGGAAPVVDGQGNIWVETGNSAFHSSSDTYDNSDGVIELSPALTVVQAWAPATWYDDNAADADLSSSPALVSADGLVFAAGKNHNGYLLSQAHLGGGGTAPLQTIGSFCSGDVDGGTAVSGTTVYEPCGSGVVAVSTAAPGSAAVSWHTSTGAGGPPIVAGGYVWTIGGSTLDALDPTTGNMLQHFSLGSEANDFPTSTVADGLLLAPSSDQVHAFDGPAGLPPPPAAPPPRPGYWTTAADGGVFSFGGAGFAGSMGGRHLVAPVVGMAATSDGGGYWLVASDGGVFAFGDAGYFGSMGGRPLAKPIVGIAAAPNGDGYWLVASDGGVFSFGASYFGSMGGRPLAKPVVGVAATSDGGGYWLVASDGGVFSFGDARFQGSMGAKRLDQPMVAMAAAPGGGYWLVASDGGIFAFGGANFFGSMGGIRLTRPVVGMTPTSTGQGYWEVASDGGIFAFGDAPFEGSEGSARLVAPMVGMAAPPLP